MFKKRILQTLQNIFKSAIIKKEEVVPNLLILKFYHYYFIIFIKWIKPQNPWFWKGYWIIIIKIIYKIKASPKMGIKPKTITKIQPMSITKLQPKNPQSSVQEGHNTFRVMNFSLHEMIKPFQNLEIPIRISVFSSPALLN